MSTIMKNSSEMLSTTIAVQRAYCTHNVSGVRLAASVSGQVYDTLLGLICEI